jgi:YegS/Rv2252/BmrU family lipid kinase
MPATVAIVNPMARSGGAAEIWPSMADALGVHFPGLEVHFTEARGHATELCRRALEAGAERVIAVGGDGTNNEVLGGFVDGEGENRFPEATLAILAAGSGGDFQRMFGRLSSPRQVRRLTEAEPRLIDYGVARFTAHDGSPALRPFLNMASAGVSASTVRTVNDADKRLGATASYVVGALQGIARHRNVQVEIAVDGIKPRRVDLTLYCVGNGQYFGAGMWICPHAEVDDGVFDLVEVTGMSRRRLVTTLAKVFKANHLRVKGVDTSRAESVSLEPVWKDAEVLIELDGEQPGRLPARFDIVPSALRLQIARA